jgi:hypothetical protein
MLDELSSETTIDAVTLSSLLHEHRNGGCPLVTYASAMRCLHALGRPVSEATVRGLIVNTGILNGRAVAPLSKFVEAADMYISRQTCRPNLKASAAAKARASKKGAA